MKEIGNLSRISYSRHRVLKEAKIIRWKTRKTLELFLVCTHTLVRRWRYYYDIYWNYGLPFIQKHTSYRSALKEVMSFQLFYIYYLNKYYMSFTPLSMASSTLYIMVYLQNMLNRNIKRCRSWEENDWSFLAVELNRNENNQRNK